MIFNRARKPLSNRQLLTVAAFGVLAAVSTFSAPARACSPPYCPPPVRLFEPGASVPGNLVYFKLLFGRSVDGELQPLAPLTLETSDHEPIAASVRTIGKDRVFAPDAPIPAGTQVVLSYQPDCYEAGREIPRATYTFSTREAASDVAMQTPTLELVDQRLSGENEQFQVFSELRYRSADATGALAHLVTLSGSIADVRGTLPSEKGTFRVATECSRKDKELIDTCGGVHSVPEGTHTLSVRSSIVGFDDPETVSAEVETSCEAPPDDDADSADQVDDTQVSSGDGCSLSRGSSTAFPPLLTLLAVFGLLLRARRMERR